MIPWLINVTCNMQSLILRNQYQHYSASASFSAQQDAHMSWMEGTTCLASQMELLRPCCWNATSNIKHSSEYCAENTCGSRGPSFWVGITRRNLESIHQVHGYLHIKYKLLPIGALQGGKAQCFKPPKILQGRPDKWLASVCLSTTTVCLRADR